MLVMFAVLGLLWDFHFSVGLLGPNVHKLSYQILNKA